MDTKSLQTVDRWFEEVAGGRLDPATFWLQVEQTLVVLEAIERQELDSYIRLAAQAMGLLHQSTPKVELTQPGLPEFVEPVEAPAGPQETWEDQLLETIVLIHDGRVIGPQELVLRQTVERGVPTVVRVYQVALRHYLTGDRANTVTELRHGGKLSPLTRVFELPVQHTEDMMFVVPDRIKQVQGIGLEQMVGAMVLLSQQVPVLPVPYLAVPVSSYDALRPHHFQRRVTGEQEFRRWRGFHWQTCHCGDRWPKDSGLPETTTEVRAFLQRQTTRMGMQPAWTALGSMSVQLPKAASAATVLPLLELATEQGARHAHVAGFRINVTIVPATEWLQPNGQVNQTAWQLRSHLQAVDNLSAMVETCRR